MYEPYLVKVVVEARGVGGEGVYTYQVPPEWEGRLQVGSGVLVPFGGRSVVGVVVGFCEAEDTACGLQLKSIETVLDQPLLEAPLWQLAEALQAETLCTPSEAVHTVLPPIARIRLRTMVQLLGTPPVLRSPIHRQVVEVLRSAGGTVSLASLKKRFAHANLQSALGAFRRKGLVRSYVELEPPPQGGAQPAQVRLVASPDQLETFFSQASRRRPAQTALLMRLLLHPEGVLPIQTLMSETGVHPSTLRQLEASGLIRREGSAFAPPAALPAEEAIPPLTDDQQEAVQTLTRALRTGKYQPFLLFGVTGSGKTEVYLRAAAESLRRGRTVLFLVPEIALTAQLVGAFQARFGQAVAVLHSQLEETQRFDQWQRIRLGKAPIVVGARSAIFAPLRNLGLILVDEEHEPAYKQQQAPRYHAARVAALRAQQEGAVLVLGSATPTLESFYAAHRGEFTLLTLPKRVQGIELPAVQVVDLRREKSGVFSSTLYEAVQETLNRDKQVILFLNRRAFAPFLLCRECGHVPLCPQCHVSLAFHVVPRELRCHHCGYRAGAPSFCPQCQGVQLAPHGVGTQRVEHLLKRLLPDTPIARLDRDVLSRRELYLELLSRFRAGEIRVLIGTQMVAKGLHFPDVQLVGVINADTALYLPDFRASERTFQLLMQVAGRAGRRGEQGRVIVQTYNPDHPAIRYARVHDYLGFYEWELAQRQELSYPPFSRLVRLLVQHEQAERARHLLATVKSALETELGRASAPPRVLLGPAPAPLARLRGEYRYHLLLKLPPDWKPAAFLASALRRLHQEPRTLLQVDIDPVSLL